MQDNQSNNKRIAKNTLALYVRTFITMIVGLYTGRVMLHALGVDNFGINAVVGGIVGFSSIITATMSAAISRYITFGIGKGNKENLKMVFSTSVTAQLLLALLVLVFLEVIGVWFLNMQANIPEGRMKAANWVLQCSILTFCISYTGSPYNAVIVAHERMNVYAYIGIIEALLKLVICYLIIAFNGDKLILFAILTLLVALGIRLFYRWYCRRYFEETHYNIHVFDKRLLKEIAIFSGWNFTSNISYVFGTQGVNMLVNVFFGVVFNASRSVAQTVNGAVQGFVSNFTVAFAPQITKSYAAGNVDYAVSLADRSTRFTWLMMIVFLVPVCVEADTLLTLWLGEVPTMAAVFLRFAMFESLTVTVGTNLFKLIQADGHLKNYIIWAAITEGLTFPLAWFAFKLGAPVWFAYAVFIAVYLLLYLVRLYHITLLMKFSISQHIKNCILPCVFATIASFVIPVIISLMFKQGLMRFFTNVAIAVLWSVFCCLLIGLTKSEKTFFMNTTLSKIRKIRPNDQSK